MSESRISQQEAEVSTLLATYPGTCKVIKDVGDFKHVVNIKNTESDLTVKFQLEDTYPSTPPNIAVKSQRLSTDCKTNLTEHLQDQASSSLGHPMMSALYDKALTWLAENEDVASIEAGMSHKHEAVGVGKKNNKKSKGSRKGQTQESSEPRPSKKLSSMKTATDVVSRILWDDQLTSDHFTIGYVDRFVGVVERSFSTFSWEDLASVDYDTLAIPKHRIQYFKYKGLTVWDKDSRTDNVFGSTGSGLTITEVIEKYEAGELGDDTDHNQIQAPAPWDPTNHMRAADSESDDDINIKTGLEGEDGVMYPRDKYWGAKSRPTHFLCLRVTDPDILSAVTQAQEQIRGVEPSYEESLMPIDRLHITLLCVGLDTKDQVNSAANLLHKLKPELESQNNPRNISVKLSGVGNFFNKVLYAGVAHNVDFLSLVHRLTLCVQEAGIEIREVFDFYPHMTLLKFKKPLQKEMRTRYLDTRVYDTLAGTEFGSQVVDNVYLCEMSENRDERGFYICPTHIKFDGQ